MRGRAGGVHGLAGGASVVRTGPPRGGGRGAETSRGARGVGATAAGGLANNGGDQASYCGIATRTGPPPIQLRPQAQWNRSGEAAERTRGPIGADGRQPLLSASWAGVAARRPAAAQAASSGACNVVRAEGGQRTAISGGAAANGGMHVGGGGGSASGPTPSVGGVGGTLSGQQAQSATGSDGFTLVPRGRYSSQRATAATTGEVGVTTSADINGGANGGGGGDGASEQPEGDGGQQAAAPEPAGEDAAEPQQADDGPSEEELQSQMSRDKRLVEWLTEQGYADDHLVRVDAAWRAAESERAWRDTRPGVAVSQRLVWAERALTRAEKAQAKQEQNLDELDRWHEAERLAQDQWLGELRDRTRKYEANLAEISHQAAVEYRSTGNGAEDGPLRDAADALEEHVTPATEDLLSQIPMDSPIRGKVEHVVGVLKGVQGTVASASRHRWADTYDIGDDASWEDGNEGDGNHGGERQNPAWDAPLYGHVEQQGNEWWRDAWGQWHRWNACSSTYRYESMDTGDVQVPPWMDPAAQRDPSAARANKRGKPNDEDPNGMQGRHVDAGDDDSGDHENAARLQAAFSDAAMAAAAATPAPTTPNGVDLALERRKQEVWDLAQDQGAEITCEAIANMASEELEEWATAYLL